MATRAHRIAWTALALLAFLASTAAARANPELRKQTPTSQGERGHSLAGSVVTAWWVIFNDPSACAGAAPDGGTCLIVPVLDPPQVEDLFAAKGCVTHGTGATVDRRGRVRLVASLYTTTRDGSPPCVLGEGGLFDPMAAEAHLVVRSHGGAIPGEHFLDQLTTFNGGCPDGPNAGPKRCADLQAAFHAPCDPSAADCDPTRSDRDVLWLPEPFLEAAGIGEAQAERLALRRAGCSTLFRSEEGLTMVIETSLEDLGRRPRDRRKESPPNSCPARRSR